MIDSKQELEAPEWVFKLLIVVYSLIVLDTAVWVLRDTWR
jgi:hypothetical protein